MVAVANTLVGPMRMTDECGKFRTAIELVYNGVLIIDLDDPKRTVHHYYADSGVQSEIQNELNRMVKAGKARQSRVLAIRAYYV